MKRITLASYRQMLASATVLEGDAYGEKVLQLADGRMVKLFRRKRWLSSALIFPYARRFTRNAQKLAALQIPTVTVVDLAWCAAVRRHLVTYQPLPGETLRQVLRCQATDVRAQLLRMLAGFIAQLHEKGVYFRSVHFGNIIVLPDRNGLGLIDVADLAVRRKGLSSGERLRNFRHLLRYAEDAGFLREFGWVVFVDGYLEAASLTAVARESLREDLQQLAEFTSTVAVSAD